MLIPEVANKLFLRHQFIDPERSVKRPLEGAGGEGGEVPGEEGLDRVIQHAQNEVMNEFLAGTSRCDEVGGDVEAEGQGSSISVQFGGNQIDVQIAEGVCDELTGRPIAHDQVSKAFVQKWCNWRHWKLATPILRRRVEPSQWTMESRSTEGGYLPKRLRSCAVPGWSFAIMPPVLKALFDLASMPLQVAWTHCEWSLPSQWLKA